MSSNTEWIGIGRSEMASRKDEEDQVSKDRHQEQQFREGKKKCRKRGYKGGWARRDHDSCINLTNAGCQWEGPEKGCVLPNDCNSIRMMSNYLSLNKSQRERSRGRSRNASHGGGLSSKSRRRIRSLKKNRRSKKRKPTKPKKSKRRSRKHTRKRN